MTTFNEAREAAYQAFDTTWADRTIHHFEGLPFKEPLPDIEWVRIVVRNFAGTTETMGDVDQKKHSRSGAVIMQIFTPADKGMKSGDEHAQFALDIFESRSIAVPGGSDTLDFIAGDVREIPLRGDEKSRQIEVEIPFDFYQTK